MILKTIRFFAGLAVIMVMIPVATAADLNSLLEKMDTLNQSGDVDNQRIAIELGVMAVETDPESYETNWKLSRACAYYTHAMQEHLVPGWEEACRVYARQGMAHAEKAMKLDADGIEGPYFFAFNAGMYSFGISILGAITEGLKNKTQRNFERVYAEDKYFEEGAVMVSLGRFWHQLPWPLRNMKESLRYYREYQASPFYGTCPNSMVIMADMLADMGGAESRREAEDILAAAMEDSSAYYLEIAREVLKKL